MNFKMTIDDALAYADEWSRGHYFHADSQGWRVVCLILAEEVRRLRDVMEQESKEPMQGITGCSDVNCLFQDNSGSVATNGGCQCEKELRYSSPTLGAKAVRKIRYLRQQLVLKNNEEWSEGFEAGRKDAIEDYHQTMDMFTSKEDALDILDTYIRLHEGKIGAHWLWSAIERIVMGEDEVDVLEDYDYIRDKWSATKDNKVKQND